MDYMDEDDLGRLLSSGASGGTRRCGLCENHLDDAGDAVEVELDAEDATQPDAWLCSPCYEHVLDDLGIAPLRVFKTGPHRTVVLPLSGTNV